MKFFYCLFIFALSIVSCKKALITETIYLNAQNKVAYFKKVASRLNVKIACEGTSLTYGQNVPGVAPPINGAGQTRALYQYPSSLQATLISNNIKAQVINRGFPGDRTVEGLTRWQDSTSANVAIIEYATNDAFNFGGYASGPLTIPVFTDRLSKIVERRIKQGAWVILTSPPAVEGAGNEMDAYKAAIMAISQKFDIPVFDVQTNVIESSADYFDGVHLTALAYQRWGIKIAPLLISNSQ
jgi:lysophospholipase L1-like esterase